MSLDTASAQISLQLLPALSDNYIFVLYHNETKEALVVDPATSAPVLSFLKKNGLRCRWILNTHHHHDHIGGNAEIQNEYPELEILAPEKNISQIRVAHHWLSGSEELQLLGLVIKVIAVPGHTLGHLAYYVPEAKLLFCGDTLFSFGCGRMFEGTPPVMWSSLKALRDLPKDTMVCCGHEYTLANLKFAQSVEPSNTELASLFKKASAQREKGEFTVPALLATEIRYNPFLRADEPELQKALGLEDAHAKDIFAELRRRKDQF